MMNEQTPTVYAGVDTHMDVHVAAVVDQTGRLLRTRSFPTTPLGLRALARWITRFGAVAKIGVEGTGSYGLGLLRVLQESGHTVIEVNRPNRQMRRSRGKSDTVDAEAAARAVLAGNATITPKTHDGVVEGMRVLRIVKSTTRTHMTALQAQIRHLVVTAPELLRVDLESMSAKERVTRAAAYRPGTDITDVTTATKTALRALARQWLALETDFKTLSDQLQELTEQANPTLLGLPGVGPDTAAALLIAAGDNPARLRSSAAFAALCGVSPIEVSSGKTQGRRLNRGGNRQANSALHRIVVVRMSRKHPATIAYLEKKTQEGKSKRHTIRCLKRYVAREVFQALKNPQPSINRDELRQRRLGMQLPLRAVAEQFDRPINAIARLETGKVHDPELAAKYDQWLTKQEVA